MQYKSGFDNYKYFLQNKQTNNSQKPPQPNPKTTMYQIRGET